MFCVDVLRLLFDLLAFEFVVLTKGTVSCWGFKRVILSLISSGHRDMLGVLGCFRVFLSVLPPIRR